MTRLFCGAAAVAMLITSPILAASGPSGPECVRNVLRALVGFDHPRNGYEQQLNNVGATYDRLFPGWQRNGVVALAAQQCDMDPALAQVIIKDELAIISRKDFTELAPAQAVRRRGPR
jgi:hypothetical protein